MCNTCIHAPVCSIYRATGGMKQCEHHREEQEHPQPLTYAELLHMHGEPVWIEGENAWGIVIIDEYGQWAGKPFVTFYYKSVRCDWDIEKRGLKCYRHKPKEV